jgi:putative acetyltransferase
MVQATFMLTLRSETPEDIPAIHHINTAAFGRPDEAELVDALRQHNALTISLVAVQDGHIGGHMAFSPVTITSDTAPNAA